MIEEMGEVVAVEKGFAWIETKVKTTCNSCVANNDCGTGLVAKAFTPKPEHLRIATPSQLSVGQQVKIGIPEQHLLSASLWLYILPLSVLIISAVFLQTYTSIPELAVIFLSFLLTFFAYWGVSRRLKSEQYRQQYTPIFLGATNQAVVSRQQEIPMKKLV